MHRDCMGYSHTFTQLTVITWPVLTIFMGKFLPDERLCKNGKSYLVKSGFFCPERYNSSKGMKTGKYCIVPIHKGFSDSRGILIGYAQQEMKLNKTKVTCADLLKFDCD